MASYAIDATLARWRGDAGSSLPDGALHGRVIADLIAHRSCTPCNAARSQRNPTIADAIDAEIELRRQDPKRVASLKSGNIDYEDFREDLRSISKNR